VKRAVLEQIALGVLRGTAWVILGATAFMLGSIAVGGAGVVTWEFLSAEPVDGMTHGGIFPAIFGTLCITLLMIAMALPLGVCAAIYMVEYAGRSGLARVIRASVNNLAGVPSIVFGLFGVGFFILFVGRSIDRVRGGGLLFGQPAMLWAAATLAALVLPVIIVSTAEALNAVPRSHREAAFALGATRLTGSILSVSRGAGETAPILFTGCAYFLPRLPVAHLEIPFTGLSIPMVNPLDQFMELSYHIFIMATQSTDASVTRPIQYGTTLVLVGLTFLLNQSAIWLRARYRRRLATP
jgi:phosphate transport system permease protein